jgi:predicted dehydrogenase
MHCLIMGCGSIGLRHAKNLYSLGQTIWCYDKDPEKEELLIRSIPDAKVYDFRSKHLHMDAFVLAMPPEYHVPFMNEAIEHTAHMFVEKPLSNSLLNVQETLKLAADRELIVQVGYQLRFLPDLIHIKNDLHELGRILYVQAEFGQYLPDWHPNEDYRHGYTAYTGISLDASHEIDYLRFLFGEPYAIKGTPRRVSDLEITAEDMNDIVMYYPGFEVHLHLDMVQRGYTRTCKIVGSEQTWTWDYKHPLYSTDPYLDEMKHFLTCIENGVTLLSDGYDALKTLELALEARHDY